MILTLACLFAGAESGIVPLGLAVLVSLPLAWFLAPLVRGLSGARPLNLVFLGPGLLVLGWSSLLLANTVSQQLEGNPLNLESLAMTGEAIEERGLSPRPFLLFFVTAVLVAGAIPLIHRCFPWVDGLSASLGQKLRRLGVAVFPLLLLVAFFYTELPTDRERHWIDRTSRLYESTPYQRLQSSGSSYWTEKLETFQELSKGLDMNRPSDLEKLRKNFDALNVHWSLEEHPVISQQEVDAAFTVHLLGLGHGEDTLAPALNRILLHVKYRSFHPGKVW